MTDEQAGSTSDGASAMRWSALIVEVPSELEDELAGILAGDSLGMLVEDAPPGSSRLSIYLGTIDGAEAVARRARTYLERRGLRADDCGVRVETVEDGRWVERYQATLQPFPLGRRFTIVPAGPAVAPSGRTPIRLVPGRAFGTGEHPTTRLCVELLERHVGRDSRWLDVGCGSGILSLVALLCGAASVIAVDNDAEAIAVARKVLQANGVRRGIELVVDESGERDPDGPWNVVCNVSARFLSDASARLAGLAGSSGVVIASGFPIDELEELRGKLQGHGLTEIERAELKGWAALVVARRPRATGDGT